ncbi:PspC domain-containing protein [Streptomyces sp. YIM S03343]
MADHQHAADQGPEQGVRSDASTAPPAPGPGPQDKEPRAHTSAHERAGTQADARADLGTGGETGPAMPAAPAEPAEVSPRFRRDRRTKMLGGVCAGLGRHYDMDPVIFRITLAVLAATGGIGLIFYGFVWLIVPYDDEDENELRKLLTGRVDGPVLASILFALVGCGVFLTMLKNGGVMTFAVILSLLLAGAGYWSQRRDTPAPDDPLAAQAVADAPPEPKAPPIMYPSWWRDPIVKDGRHVGGTGYLWGPSDSRNRDVAAAVNIGRGTPWAGRPVAGVPRPPVPRPRAPRWIGSWVFLLALLAGGLGTGLTWRTHPLGTSLQTGLACALIVLGLGIAVSSFLGRTGAGSMFLAIVTAGLLAAAAAIPKDVTTHWERVTWRPATVAEVQPKYELGTGKGVLDLSRLPLGKGQTLSAAAEVKVGKLQVIVPKGVTVKAGIDMGVGDIQLPGEKKKDVDVQPDQHKRVTLAPSAGSAKGGTIDLDLRIGAGQVEVTRAAS